MKRRAAVAGMFYEADPVALKGQVAGLIDQGAAKVEGALAAICPHAGYMYSGEVAGAVYGRLPGADTFILLGPNHTGMGREYSLMAEGAWDMPQGQVAVDGELARRLMEQSPQLQEDPQAHIYEHSLEVQVPFIQHTNPGARIVPITVMGRGMEDLRAIGAALARVVAGADKRVMLVASTDMSHFVSDEEARRRDKYALERIEALDPVGLYDVVHRMGITMCGVLPTVITLFAALELGARAAELIKYTTSAEASGDYGRVVGYAGFVVRK